MTKLYIGIDPGTDTGLAIWNPETKQLTLHTLTILKAVDIVADLHKHNQVTVWIENPNLRKWFGNSGREKLQGAGSVKRDYAIWKEFFIEQKIDYIPVVPGGNKMLKMDQIPFNKLTGYLGKSSVHARDAASMVWGRK